MKHVVDCVLCRPIISHGQPAPVLPAARKQSESPELLTQISLKFEGSNAEERRRSAAVSC